MEAKQEIKELMEFSDDELIIEIYMRSNSELELFSPFELLNKAKEHLDNISKSIKDMVCSRKELIDKPEIELAIEISAILSQSLELALANLIAVYVVKRGLLTFCK